MDPVGTSMGETGDKLEAITGAVKWFDPRKGYGFIVGPENQDIFVHYSVIEGEGFRVLNDGASVEYDAERSDKGWRASRVVRTEQPEKPEKAPDETDGPPEGSPEVVVPKRTYSRTPRR